jgi:hypothetical protein
MRDKQATASLPSGRIPVISPVLHCLSMPILVFWRRKFGYAYLSPKSVFFASIFANCLFSYMVWNDPVLTPTYAALATFGVFASVLYTFHFLACVGSEVGRGSEHDQFSGSSRIIAILPSEQREKAEGLVHGAVEPALTILLGAIFWANILGKVLVVFGLALGCKELIRYWLSLRGDKRVSDSMNDAKDISKINPSAAKPLLPTAGRTEQEIYTRRYEKDLDEEARYAEILRMLPPYTFADAEANASRLAENIDPETRGSKEQIRRINEALEYFRSWQA